MNKEALQFLLALKIKELRLTQNLSLKDLANKSQVSISYLNEIEKAKKYPKGDKLMAIAAALGVSYDDLVSTKVKKSIQPIVNFYQEDMFNKLPMSEFGITESDLFDLVSYNPTKFSSLLITMQEITRTYDINLPNINRAALRAYQESNNNYFESIELKVDEFLKSKNLPATKRVDIEFIKSVLVNEYDYMIDEKILKNSKGHKNTRSVFKKGSPNKLLVNGKLGESQKLFVYARELGSCLFGGKRQTVTGSGVEVENYKDIFHDFKASYFAGALLLHRSLIVDDIEGFFKLTEFVPEKLDEIMSEYNVGSEVFFHRLSQILPKFFGLKNLFFLRSNHHLNKKVFTISKEMHLARLHKPHGSRLKEHYCRRWITIYLLKDFFEEGSKERLFGAQISQMGDSSERYLCLSVARKSNLRSKTNSCLTVGLLVNDNSREKIKFIDDPKLSQKVVGQTCERCEISDCTERVAPATIFKAKERKRKRKEELNNIFESL